MKRIIILMGLPGSGKGTQGELLSKDILLPHISTGDIFRQKVLESSEDAKILSQYMNTGQLVPSTLVNNIVRKYILSDKCQKGCILDGYPRTLSQTEFFIENIDADITVIFFEIDQNTAIQRILNRLYCTVCGKIYTTSDTKLLNAMQCNVCGNFAIESRVDDDKKTVLLRLAEYTKETLPMVNYYQSKGNFFVVNANQDKEIIAKEVALIVKKI